MKYPVQPYISIGGCFLSQFFNINLLLLFNKRLTPYF